jgi:NCS1 family nucleobase:cation symporter-1
MNLKTILTWARLPSADRTYSSIWINDDIRPLEPERRTWTTATFISFWLVNQIARMNHSIIEPVSSNTNSNTSRSE